jgi:hypothetical protein
MAAELSIEQFMVGMRLEDIEETVSLFSYSSLRILNETDVVSAEHDSNRLNIIHNNGIVTKVYFG